MVKIYVFIVLCFFLWGSFSNAQQYDDTPQPDETFSAFFMRITHGGQFRGIRLKAPDKVQSSFLKRIKKGSWVGQRDQVYKQLSTQGVDVWNDWLQRTNTDKILFPTLAMKDAMLEALQQVITEDQAQCDPSCPIAEEILNTPWEKMSSFFHQSFVKAYVFKAKLFNNRALITYLSDLYDVPGSQAVGTTTFKLLSNRDFEKAVRDAGWGGPIYFRGITMPDPKVSGGHLVILNDDMLGKNSPFDNALYRQLEVVGIVTHEMSHVMQDLRGYALGLDVQVTSAETALVIEGMAEHWAEQALRKAGAELRVPSALSAFVEAQAVEIVFREGNESTGNLFPYTVGLPFAASLDDLVADDKKAELRDGLLGVLGRKESLEDFLAARF